MSLELTPGITVDVEPPALPAVSVSAPNPTVTVTIDTLTPTGVTVDVPTPPLVTIGAPSTNAVTVLAVAGPPGPQGPPGESGISAGASYVWQQQNSTYLVQIVHNLGFYPAGVTAIDTAGDNVEYASVAYPSVDIVEVSFDLLFTGTVYLS